MVGQVSSCSGPLYLFPCMGCLSPTWLIPSLFFSGPHSISTTHCGVSWSPCLKLQSSHSRNSFYSLFCCFLPFLTNLTTVQSSSSSFLVVSLGISRYSTNIICKQSQFYFFSNLNSFSVSSVIAVSKTSKITILDKSGTSCYPYLVPYLVGNAFSFSLLIMMLTVDLS